MKAPLYVIDGPAVVTKRGGRILVARDGVVLASAPIMCLSEVVVFGQVGITTPALHALLRADVPVVFLRSDGRALGRLEPVGSRHVFLRQLQTMRSSDPEARLHVARACVAGKLHNQRILVRNKQRRSEHAKELERLVEQLARQETAARHADSIPALVGIEGAGSGAYFRAVRLLAPDGGRFHRRDRGAPDVVNALLNYCSALLREHVLGTLVAAGLDPNASFLHTPTRGRPTLAFDLMEEWRPVLLESTVLALLGLRIVTGDDFYWTADGPRLTKDACAAAVTRFRKRLDSPARTWPPRTARPAYGECIRRQSLRFRRWIEGDAESYETFRLALSTWVATYDLSADRTRTSVAGIFAPHGPRILYSTFEFYASLALADALFQAGGALLGPNDRLFVVPLCARCRIAGHGGGLEPPADLPRVVL